MPIRIQVLDDPPDTGGPSVFVRDGDQWVRLDVQDILYVESDDDQAHIATAQRRFTVNRTLKQVLEGSPESLRACILRPPGTLRPTARTPAPQWPPTARWAQLQRDLVQQLEPALTPFRPFRSTSPSLGERVVHQSLPVVHPEGSFIAHTSAGSWTYPTRPRHPLLPCSASC